MTMRGTERVKLVICMIFRTTRNRRLAQRAAWSRLLPLRELLPRGRSPIIRTRKCAVPCRQSMVESRGALQVSSCG